MTIFNPSRDQARQFLVDAWRKHCERLPQSPLEIMASDLIAMHPEYHALLTGTDALEREWTPEQGELNPFLHLSLHLAIEEQLQIDQPPGICAILDNLTRRLGYRHEALHEMIECLGETIWRAQQNKASPDAEAYLECLRRRC